MTTDVYTAAREIKATMVMHPEFERVLAAGDEMVERASRTGEPLGFIVTADPGMGKSAVLEFMSRRLRQRFASMTNDEPLVRLEFDAMVDTFKVAGALLEALGYPLSPARTNLVAMTKMADTALERLTPYAAFIDEAQHVCEGCREITARATTDWLKVRMDRNCLSYVLAGTQVLGRLRQINPQFTSRAPADFVIRTFTYSPAWHQLLGGFVGNVKAVDLGVLQDRKIAKRVFDGSQGNLRRLKRWLAPSTALVAQDGRAAMTPADLRLGFDIAFGSNSIFANPFADLS